MRIWHEIVVEGQEKALRAFVAGFQTARGRRVSVFYGSDFELETGSFSERLRELFASGSHHLLFAPKEVATLLLEALRKHGREAGLRVDKRYVVDRARMPFTVEAFSPEVAAKTREATQSSLPPGIVLEGLEEESEEEPGARGAELYAPTHDFTYRASGVFVGPLPGVLEMQRRARNTDFVTAAPVEMETREIT
jgi:hypothetical protein